jgi:hypothetical protein
MPAPATQPIIRYDLRIQLPSLSMRSASPWFLESSYRVELDAEARYDALLLVAQNERGSIELVKVRAHGQGARTDLRTLLAWSYRPGQSALGLRAWPMDAGSRVEIERKASDLARRAAAGEVLVTDSYAPVFQQPDKLVETPTALPLIARWRHLAAGAALCCLLLGAFQIGRTFAEPDVTAAMVGVLTPRWCLEIDANSDPIRIWTEHPQMGLLELMNARKLRGTERLRGSKLGLAIAERNLKRLNYREGAD